MENFDLKNILETLINIFNTSHVFAIFIILSIVFIVTYTLLLAKRKYIMGKEKYEIYKSIFSSAIIVLFFLIIYLSITIYFPHYKKYPQINKLLLVLLTLSLGIFFYRLSVLLAIFIKNAIAKTINKEIDNIIFKWTSIALKVLVFLIVFFIVLKIYNINISTLVAGLGIGGIAVALAAQDSISNILGCAIIILDKPFVIGNRIKILEYDGNIESIGIRSIRIRTFDGSLIVVPNKTVANANIENVTSRTSIREVQEIKIEPSLNNNEIKNLVILITDILKEHPKIKNDYTVFFDKRDAISITIKIIYYSDTTDYNEYMKIKEDVNYSLNELISNKNIKYAHPSSIVYIANK